MRGDGASIGAMYKRASRNGQNRREFGAVYGSSAWMAQQRERATLAKRRNRFKAIDRKAARLAQAFDPTPRLVKSPPHCD